MQLPKYIPGIDGLRAIAVGLVIAFHLEPSLLTGGFIGVDVFFVISGFLITGIIIEEIDAGRFSYGRFLLRRVRRLAPALLTVLAFASIVAYLIELPDELGAFSSSLISTISLVSNFHFMTNGGYFSQPAETQLLLHTWSLSVEEQFYLIFPLCLLTASAVGIRMASLLKAALALSVAFNALILYLVWRGVLADSNWAQASGAFFFTPFRFYEILIGANLASFFRACSLRVAPAAAVIGLAAIVFCAVTFNGGMYYPGLWGLFPSLGAALVIAGVSKNNGFASWMLTRPSMRFLGRISYSLYLWHWPIICAWSMLFPDHRGPIRIIAILALTIAFASASNRFIEWPIYRGNAIKSRKWLMASIVTSIGVLLVLPIAALKHEGLPWRIPPALLAQRNEASTRPLSGFADCDSKGLCVINGGSDAEPSFLFWGDSHAEALLPAISTAAKSSGVSGLYIQHSGCVALFGVWQDLNGYDAECQSTGHKAAEAIKQHPSIRTVIIASRWALYQAGDRYLNDNGNKVVITDASGSRNTRSIFANGLSRTVRAIHELGADTYFVRQVPEIGYPVTDTWMRRQMLGIGAFSQEDRARYDKRNSDVDALLRVLPNVRTIDLTDRFCDARYCRTFAGGIPIYRDNNHITSAFSASISDSFLPALMKAKITSANR